MLPPTPLSEEEKAGKHEEMLTSSTEKIECLFMRYLDVVLSFVSYRVPNRSEAEDITAEILAAAVVAYPKFRHDCGPRAWLLGIARQKITKATRRRDRTKRRELLETDLSLREKETLSLLLVADIRQLPEDGILREEARSVMLQLLTHLTEPQREALLLQVRHCLSIREIAQVLGRSEAATNTLLQQARATIFQYGKGYLLGDTPRNEE
jgi:RNA polymerase sigma-70 factor (ECF subfamily)